MATLLVESAAELQPEVRQALRDLILVLADSTRLLGFRYGGWILGAPELETGIACAAMAQDEWGHARLLYALLKDFGEDVDHLEHGREPHAYFSMQVLDREPEDWAGMVALNALADAALSIQLEALRDCCYLPLRQRTEKVLAEEQYHRAHGNAWARRFIDASAESADALERAVRAALPPILFWFGLEGGRGTLLARAGACNAGPDDLRGDFLARNAPLLNALSEHGPEAWSIGLREFDDVRRRGPGGPDAATIARVRGDLNRDFLVE